MVSGTGRAGNDPDGALGHAATQDQIQIDIADSFYAKKFAINPQRNTNATSASIRPEDRPAALFRLAECIATGSFNGAKTPTTRCSGSSGTVSSLAGGLSVREIYTARSNTAMLYPFSQGLGAIEGAAVTNSAKFSPLARSKPSARSWMRDPTNSRHGANNPFQDASRLSPPCSSGIRATSDALKQALAREGNGERRPQARSDGARLWLIDLEQPAKAENNCAKPRNRWKQSGANAARPAAIAVRR
jgi:hypothetical protein